MGLSLEKARLAGTYYLGRYAESAVLENLENCFLENLLDYTPLNAKKIKEELRKRKK